MSDSLQPHESQHARPPCPSPTPGVYSNSCSLSRWCHPAVSSSAIPFSSCPQSLPASGSLPMSQLFAWGGQSIGISASASVLPMIIQDWSPLRWTGWISLYTLGKAITYSSLESGFMYGSVPMKSMYVQWLWWENWIWSKHVLYLPLGCDGSYCIGGM